MNTGDGKVRPNIWTDRSRSAAPTNMRGIRPQRSNASRLARCVRSSPAPPATYDHTDGDIARSARASNSAKAIGSAGAIPPRPLK